MQWVNYALIALTSLTLLIALGAAAKVIYSLFFKKDSTTDKVDETPDRAWRHRGKD